jgi:hypothetical protein
MAGDKDRKGFSGLLDLASTISEINEPIKPEPKEEAVEVSDICDPIRSGPKEKAIRDSDVKKESRETLQNAGVSIDPSRALPKPNTVSHGDSDESEAVGVNISFGLMFALMIAMCFFLIVIQNDNKVKSDRVLTSSKLGGNAREKRVDDDVSLMDIPTDTPLRSTPVNKDLPQQNGSRRNSQGNVVLPKAQTESSVPSIEIQSPSRNGRTEENLLFGENGKGKARLANVDFGAVVLSDGKRYSITRLSSSDFSHLMRNYDARSIGFEMPLRLVDQERTWRDASGVYSRKAKLFAKSGYVIILLSNKNVYHHIEYSELSGRDRQYVDSIDFSLPSNDPFLDVAPDSYKGLELYDYVSPPDNPFDD